MDPILEQALRRRIGGLPMYGVPDAPPPEEAPPPAPPSVDAPPPPPVQEAPPDFRAMLYRNLGDMSRSLGPDFDPAALRSAQRQDLETSAGRTLADQLTRGATLIRNRPVADTVTPNISTEAMQRLVQRRGDVLGTAEAAGKLQGMLLQQSLYDPNSPMSRMYQDQIAKLDPEYAQKRYGGPEGLRMAPGFLIKQDLEARKGLADIQKTGAEADKARAELPGILAEAMAKRRANDVVTPDFIAQVQRNLGIQLTPDMRYGEAEKRIDEALKARGQDVDLMKWRAEHSPAIAPGVLYTGPGIPNPDEARDFREKLAATNKLHGLLGDYRDLVQHTDRLGKLAGPEAAKLRAIHGELMAEVRTLIGAKTLTDSDIKLADAIVPEAAGTAGLKTWTSSTLAAIDTIMQHSREGIQKVGDSRFYHVFDPSAAFGPERQRADASVPSSPVAPQAPPSLRREE